jgi:hypothetical protein
MESLMLTIYVLMWPALVLGVFAVLLRGFMADLNEARRRGRGII